MVGAQVAVLGAGMLGTATALELARRGYTVDLFDRGRLPITGAGLNNEGKLHLGFVYANDATGHTVELVAGGSVRFFGLLRRWIGADVDRLPVSAPFLYAVPHQSLLRPTQVRAHAEQVLATVERLAEAAEADGLPRQDVRRVVVPGQPVAELSAAALRRSFAPDQIAAAFVVPEVGVDPRAVALAMRAAVSRSGAIRFRAQTTVERVDGDGHALTVVTSGRTSDRQDSGEGSGEDSDGLGRTHQEAHGPYQHVVNALWDGRLPIDLARGQRPPHRWLWRSKLSLRVPVALSELDLPSVTYLLGPFGDMVDYRNGCSYLSWYPAGLLGLSDDPTPPAAWGQLDAEARATVARRSLAALTDLAPGLRRLPDDAVRAAEVVGGAIFAYGETDIDDPNSGLHQRSGPAVRSAGGYHSVDPGKFCLTPLFAVQVADRIAACLGSHMDDPGTTEG